MFIQLFHQTIYYDGKIAIFRELDNYFRILFISFFMCIPSFSTSTIIPVNTLYHQH